MSENRRSLKSFVFQGEIRVLHERLKQTKDMLHLIDKIVNKV